MEPVTQDASKLLDDLSEDELDSAFSRVVSPAPRAPAAAEPVSVAGERLHSLVSRSEVQQLAEDELARVHASSRPVEWFLADGGRPSGPFDLDEVQERWTSGQIGPDTPCWGDGLTGWTPICRVPALTAVLAPAPAATADLSEAVPQEAVEMPRASEALKDLIEEPLPVAPAPVAPVAAPRMALPPLPEPAPVGRKGVSHGRVALYVGLSATAGAIAGGALVGLFAVQLLRFLPGSSAPPPQPVVQSTPAPAPAAVAPGAPAPVVAVAPAPAPKVEAAPPSPPEPVQPAPEPPKEHKAEAHRAKPPPTAESAPAKKEKPAPSADDGAEVIEAAPPPAESASSPEVADDFDQAFGPAPSEAKAPTSKSGKTVYVPPAPGKAPKAQLSQGEIMQVVVANKDQVVKCLDTARQAEPALSGKLLMRWTVMPSGETSDVEALPGDLAGSELAHCVTRAIQGWKFPQHVAEQQPITFPFVF